MSEEVDSKTHLYVYMAMFNDLWILIKFSVFAQPLALVTHE